MQKEPSLARRVSVGRRLLRQENREADQRVTSGRDPRRCSTVGETLHNWGCHGVRLY